MAPKPQIVVDNSNCNHEWREGYYGYQCIKCPVFIAYGCEPWVDYSDDDKATKIIEGLREAVAGNFARVMIEGQTWMRADPIEIPPAGPIVECEGIEAFINIRDWLQKA